MKNRLILKLLSRIGFLLYDNKFDVEKFKEDGVNLRLRQASEREDLNTSRVNILSSLGIKKDQAVVDRCDSQMMSMSC